MNGDRFIMRTALAICVVVGSLVSGATAASAQTAGDWVLARYRDGQYWFPGIIQSIQGDKTVVAYDDGDRETLDISRVRPYTWSIGGRVECNFKGLGNWYPGVIASLGGETIEINYDDGDRERTKTGRCRSK